MRHFPHIIADTTEQCILNRAASSNLSKALFFIQVTWFSANCASRLFQGLPLSLLEVSTAAHAFCTLLTYFVWWSKPINVPTPTLLRGKEAREVYALLKCSHDEYGKALEMAQKRAAGDFSMPTGSHISEKIVLAAYALQHLLPNPEQPPHSRRSRFDTRDRMPVPGYIINKSPNEELFSAVTLAMSPMLYGLIHFLAWSGQFPTPLERRLWRVSSFVVSCSGLVGVFMRLLWTWLVNRYIHRITFKGFTKVRVIRAVTVVMAITAITAITAIIRFIIIPLAHVLASGFLIVESVRQLFFLNDAAYQLPSWSNYWPQFS